jgi:hypothetical protein
MVGHITQFVFSQRGRSIMMMQIDGTSSYDLASGTTSIKKQTAGKQVVRAHTCVVI